MANKPNILQRTWNAITNRKSISEPLTSEDRPGDLLSKVQPNIPLRTRRDWLGDLNVAIAAAENYIKPDRRWLYNIYHEILRDPHLTAKINLRISQALSCKWCVYDKEGEVDPIATEMLTRPWVHEAMKSAMMSKFWGYTLMELAGKKQIDGRTEFTECLTFEYRNLWPPQGRYMVGPADLEGQPFRDNSRGKLLLPNLLEAGDVMSFGNLYKIAPDVIFKKESKSQHANFNELFGIPFRTMHTDVRDSQRVANAERMMQSYGAAGYAILDMDDKIEYIEGVDAQGDTFLNFINYCNQEIDKFVLGNVLGSSSDEKGNRALGQIHQENQDSITEDDQRWLQEWMNLQVYPVLLQAGYPIKGTKFAIMIEEGEVDTVALATRDVQINSILTEMGMSLDPDYIEDTYKVKIVKNGQPVDTETGEEPDDMEALNQLRAKKRSATVV